MANAYILLFISVTEICVSTVFEGRSGNCAHFYTTGMCGTCYRCDPYFYASLCGHCSSCNPCKHGSTFDINCTCHDGCPDNRYGESCQWTCPNGCVHCDQTWPDICYDHCGLNCVDGICSNATGHCLRGCAVKNFYGPFCTNRCSQNCKYQECDSTGHCLHGCENGYYGVMCEHSCSSKCKECTTRQNCTSCRRPDYYGDACDKPCYGCLQVFLKGLQPIMNFKMQLHI